MPIRSFSSLLLTVAMAACATAPQHEGAVYDPLEPLNRQVFAFNEASDKRVIGPVTEAYVAVTPGFFRAGVGNFLSNLNSPVVFTNDVLQGEPKRAGDTLYRFLVNSTFGVFGVLDVAASETGIEGHSEDFGQTLAVWGVPDGPFLVLPFLGPSNLRDVSGMGVDTALDPLTWTEFEDADLDDQIAYTRTAFGVLGARIAAGPALEAVREQPEPYIAFRRGYTSQRDAAIRNGREEADPYTDLPDFDDFE